MYFVFLDRKMDVLYTGEELYCDGDSSCTKAVIQQLDGNRRSTIKYVTCSGSHACSYADIRSVDILRLYGEFSARSTANYGRIKDVSLIKAYGYRALLDATIDSGSLDEMTVKAIGNEAGYGAKILCRSGATCDVICRDNGCDTLKYICRPGATCNVSPSGCLTRERVGGIICPRMKNGAVDDEEENENSAIDEHDEENMDEFKVDTDGMNEIIHSDNTCDGNVANGCEGEHLNGGPYQCRGLESCKDSLMNDDAYFYCLAEKACINAEINNNEGKTTQCLGYQSCKDVIYQPDEEGGLWGWFNCGGKESCVNIKPKPNTIGIKNSLCLGSSSCQKMEMISGNYDVRQCYANKACYSSKISTNTTIICSGKYSCAKSEIIMGEGKSVRIPEITCAGRVSCANTVMDVYHNIYLEGQYSGRSSDLSASGIYGSGYYALPFTTIDSKDKDTNVSLTGHLAGYRATFICRSGSVCSLECASTACRNMDYVCLNGATCDISPSECANGGKYDGIECPNMLTSIPSYQKDYSNDKIYQYQEWEMEQDETLQDLLDNHADSDTIEEFLLSNLQKNDLETEIDEMELFGVIENVGASKYEYDIKILFGICSVLFIIGSLIYLGYKMKSNKSEYESL